MRAISGMGEEKSVIDVSKWWEGRPSEKRKDHFHQNRNTNTHRQKVFNALLFFVFLSITWSNQNRNLCTLESSHHRPPRPDFLWRLTEPIFPSNKQLPHYHRYLRQVHLNCIILSLEEEEVMQSLHPRLIIHPFTPNSNNRRGITKTTGSFRRQSWGDKLLQQQMDRQVQRQCQEEGR